MSAIVDTLKGQDFLIITLPGAAIDQSEKLTRAAAGASLEWVMPNDFASFGTNHELANEVLFGSFKGYRDLIESLA